MIISFFFYSTNKLDFINTPLFGQKCFLQTNLEGNFPNFCYIFLLNVNFENQTVRLYVIFVFNTRQI